ncbi:MULTISPECIES: hypothetical protein [Bacillus amyloliquefaciens group]|uniref:hypothetical protein n=1 Tax=Bacillus amyloliquefaciens group TaxID=1938374 RepID=UPI001459BCE4|nr:MULTISPECIES: hypothetical protein [Bacillus amyloliquefaciens group]MCR4365419.1 hypothetical protein [Bacillus amyloliquefaciens]MCV3201916.1 hypothetical protein [Bacillus velezensis]NME93941.1 hypothetical protein [Bacillus velezensis]QXW51579.1 hypothetical protein KXY09_10480 [Bacillus velezensis]
MKKILTAMMLFLNDFLFIIGAAFILATAYRLHTDIGLVLTGVFFIFYALLLSKKRR